MKLSAKKCDPVTLKTECLAVGVYEGKVRGPLISAINKALNGHIKRSVGSKLFEGKPGETLLVDSLGKFSAKKVLLVGLGQKKEVTLERVRQMAGKSATVLRNAGVKQFAITLPQADLKKAGLEQLGQAVAEGIVLALYTFDRFKTTKETKEVRAATLVASSKENEILMAKGLKTGLIIAESTCFARDLVNAPGNIATPSYLADQAKNIARKFGIKIKVLGPAQIAKLKMGALMGVAMGSHQPARFIVLEWFKGPKKQKPIVLVGKGLTFDTGGISIKPSANMEEMKSDMAGGGAILGAMRAAAALKLKVNLVGLVPATENMPGGSAIKPGDVVTGLSGVTMEVINTDAEGRLILSDALAYAKRYKPDCVVDMATLTGACMVALGTFASGLFGTDESLIGQIKEAGEETGERCWPMPLWKEYEELIKSDVADIKNVGPRWGGAITAAAFLKNHVEGKWAHIDIAGTALNSKPRGYLPKGGTGIGVRLMIEFIRKRSGA